MRGDIQVLCLEAFVYRDVPLKEIFGEIPVLFVGDRDVDPQRVVALLVGLEHVVDPSFLVRYPNLQVVATATTGDDHIRLPDSISVLRLQSEEVAHISATAEFTFGLLLALVRKIPFSLASEQSREALQGRQLQGKTLGIIGLGRLGRRMKRYAEAFDMTTLSYDREDDQDRFTHLLAESHVISVHLPLNQETTGFLGHDAFAAMRRRPYLINTSRPAVVDREALLTALREQTIAGLAMDFQNYDGSKPPDAALVEWAADRVVCTPHIAGNTLESVQTAATITAKKLARLLGREERERE